MSANVVNGSWLMYTYSKNKVIFIYLLNKFRKFLKLGLRFKSMFKFKMLINNAYQK